MGPYQSSPHSAQVDTENQRPGTSLLSSWRLPGRRWRGIRRCWPGTGGCCCFAACCWVPGTSWGPESSTALPEPPSSLWRSASVRPASTGPCCLASGLQYQGRPQEVSREAWTSGPAGSHSWHSQRQRDGRGECRRGWLGSLRGSSRVGGQEEATAGSAFYLLLIVTLKWFLLRRETDIFSSCQVINRLLSLSIGLWMVR